MIVFWQNAFLVKHGLTSDDLAKIDPFVPSPIIEGYRNKCEFSFGNHPFTGEITVGFR
jgi:tRNA/tmRNA/rRNA uracil-C5-methylase (TrmA/RlmC/RlmD family)